MGKITDISQSKRLKECGINIKTKYKTKDKICERNTDQSRNENVENGIRIEKLYYRNGTVIHRSRDFDSRILYTYVADGSEKDTFVCPNCGAVCGMNEVEEGCPYCGTFLNLDYSHKDLGTKYTYDRTMKSTHYVKITLLVDFVFSLIIAWLYISATGRTFNIYDMLKVLAGAVTLCAILFYVFYYLDALIVLWPIKYYKDKINKRQIDFWKRMEEMGIQKEKFYNNFNYEISRFYFERQEDVIDYDIIDYNSLQDFYHDNVLNVRVNVTIRLIRYNSLVDKIVAETVKENFVLAYQGPSTVKLSGGVNQISCRNCGASIDVTAKSCPYCNTEYHSFQEWYLQDGEK